MKRYACSSCAAFVIVLAACQWPSVRPGDDAEKRDLRERIAELEARLQATGSPSPESIDVTPAPETSSETAQSGESETRRPQKAQKLATSTASQPAPGSKPAETETSDEISAAEPAPSRQREERQAVVREWSIENGSELTLVFETPLSSQSSQVGDSILTRVERAVDAHGHVCLPGGSTLSGRVTRVKGAARVGGKAVLAMTFDRLTVRRQRQRIEPFTVVLQGGSDLKRDGALVAGGAVAGAVLGGILDGGKGAKKGAAIGAAGGAGAAVATKGEKIVLNAGHRMTVTVRRTARNRD